MYRNNSNLSSAGHRGLLLSLFALVVASVPLAAQPPGAAVDPAIEATLRQRLNLPGIGLGVKSVEPSELKGMYRVQLEQGPAVYSTENGEFFIVGDLYTVGASGLVNLAEKRRAVERQVAVEAVPTEQQIVFAAEGETRAHITVFTDVSCFYCQKLHKEVPELNRRGVEVRYLAYPRQGIASEGFRQLASAWCADDRPTTLTRLKNREEVPENVCAGNPIAAQFDLGQKLGVRGTPAIITATGELIPGYRSADDLVGVLGLD
ncbi:MAG: thiol:disulfide interchange protein DsbC [Halieaceae bacterium]|jgi:thiol:disulfide interchange protein DsbC